MDSDKVLVPGALEQEAASIIERCARLIQQGVTCCVSTKRTPCRTTPPRRRWFAAWPSVMRCKAA